MLVAGAFLLNYCKSNKYQKSLRLFDRKENMYCANNESLKKNGILNQDLGSDTDQQATDNQQLSNIGVHLEVHPYMHNWLGLPNEHFGPNLRFSCPQGPPPRISGT
jgi:hypothetical protein